ncbi:hypothetical protein [Nonomuraea roseola]|uniref:Uncharacterized protein n=1 Tax=Nonomuraea roseola TaxID=46179 RepID=A0ABV5PS19_9ACTN
MKAVDASFAIWAELSSEAGNGSGNIPELRPEAVTRLASISWCTRVKPACGPR